MGPELEEHPHGARRGRQQRSYPPGQRAAMAARQHGDLEPRLVEPTVGAVALGAQEQQTRLGRAPPQFLGQREPREQVSARSATSECNSHDPPDRRTAPATGGAASASTCDATFMSRPTAAMVASSDEPPELTSGSARPFVGADDVTTAMFTTA